MPQPADRVHPPGFARILQKYLDQQCTEEEKRLVEEWYADLEGEKPPQLKPAELELQKEALWQKIALATVKASPKTKVISLNAWINPVKYGSAAALILLAAWAWIFGINSNLFKKAEPAFTLVENQSLKDRLVKLPDGSQVILKPAGKLRYNFAHQHKREVFLTGEAFFQVTRNTKRPFLVHTGKVITRVLGTSFSVKYNGDKSQEVAVQVKTGRVAVSKLSTKADKLLPNKAAPVQVVLLPNQQAEFNPQKEQFKVQLVKAPAIIQKAENTAPLFLFRETELAEVAQILEKAYGIQIVLTPNLKNCPLTADLAQEDFYEKLDLICGALQANYQIKGTRIYLSGKGCSTE